VATTLLELRGEDIGADPVAIVAAGRFLSVLDAPDTGYLVHLTGANHPGIPVRTGMVIERSTAWQTFWVSSPLGVYGGQVLHLMVSGETKLHTTPAGVLFRDGSNALTPAGAVAPLPTKVYGADAPGGSASEILTTEGAMHAVLSAGGFESVATGNVLAGATWVGDWLPAPEDSRLLAFAVMTPVSHAFAIDGEVSDNGVAVVGGFVISGSSARIGFQNVQRFQAPYFRFRVVNNGGVTATYSLRYRHAQV
jgi:hypothetical protein